MTSIRPADQALLTRLGSVAAQADPPPSMAFELGRAAFATRDLDAELMQLVEEMTGELAGVRSTMTHPRVVSFEGAGVALDLQVISDRGHVDVVGQVIAAPHQGGVVRVESADGSVRVAQVDQHGGFVVHGLPESMLRLRVELTRHNAITTPWFGV